MNCFFLSKKEANSFFLTSILTVFASKVILITLFRLFRLFADKTNNVDFTSCQGVYD